MRPIVWVATCFLLLSSGLAAGQQPVTSERLKALKWRTIGPTNMGGRVTDIDGIPDDPKTFYESGADAGVFKTSNGGVTFEALFTDQRAYAVGALAIAPSDHNAIWRGSGEGDARNRFGYGNGFNRSENGGKSRKKVLYIDEDIGCSDIAIKIANQRVRYAGLWTFRHRALHFDVGKKQTALYRLMDGGEGREKLTYGLLDKPMARIGVAIAQSQSNIADMITDVKIGGTLFRSDDRGDCCPMVNDDPNINFRPFDYSDIRLDMNNPEVVYSLSGGSYKSMDGGKTFRRIARGVRDDHQSFWINPVNPNRLLSFSDGGETWDIINIFELSQLYQIFVGTRNPYFVYGNLQDNGTWVGPSNSLRNAGIFKRDWVPLAGGDGYYAVQIPGNERQVYINQQGSAIFHLDSKINTVRNILPYSKIIGSAGDAIFEHKYRFNWDLPIPISPHDRNTVYFGGNVLFKSTDRGCTWEKISSDLTANDKSTQRSSGGENNRHNTEAEFHCTILTITESPVEKGLICYGTDERNIQITRDGRKTWTNVKDRMKGLPAFAWMVKIHASEHDTGTAFVTVDQHRVDDFQPHVIMTTDYGPTWRKISGGLSQDDYAAVIRQDPHVSNLLYVGMELGIYASWDAGKTWTRINNNLPPVSVRNLRVQPVYRDRVVSTHGRKAWILDDIRPLQELAAAGGKTVHLFESRPATRWHILWTPRKHRPARLARPEPRIRRVHQFFAGKKCRQAGQSQHQRCSGKSRTHTQGHGRHSRHQPHRVGFARGGSEGHNCRRANQPRFFSGFPLPANGSWNLHRGSGSCRHGAGDDGHRKIGPTTRSDPGRLLGAARHPDRPARLDVLHQ